MTLANYINDLLYRYDCVIVPEFGGFVTNKIGAKVNNFTHTFHPPTKQISFNSHLKHNDGLLANYIAKIENISFEVALSNIENTVSKWQNDLEFKSIEIGSVGSLSLNDKKQLIFEPNASSNFLTTSFGLSAVESPAVKRLEYKEQVRPLIVNTEKEENRKGIPVFVKYAAAAAILLTLGYTGWNRIQEDQQNEIFAEKEQKLQKKIQSATFVIDNPLPTINLNVDKDDSKKFHLIAGAFQFEENAEKKVQELINEGFNAYVLGKNSWGLTQVVFDSFKTKEEARVKLMEIKESVSEDAWLLVK